MLNKQTETQHLTHVIHQGHIMTESLGLQKTIKTKYHTCTEHIMMSHIQTALVTQDIIKPYRPN